MSEDGVVVFGGVDTHRDVHVAALVDGTGSYGAGLARYLSDADIEVVEVNRPNRQLRRQRGGKSDSVDAEAAARGEATAVPSAGGTLANALSVRQLWRSVTMGHNQGLTPRS